MDANPFALEAIARRLCLEATYNRADVLLAPHILYTRHGAMFVDAATLERDGRPAREVKLGCFRLEGLGTPRVSARRFAPQAFFDRGAERYAGVTLFAVDTSDD